MATTLAATGYSLGFPKSLRGFWLDAECEAGKSAPLLSSAYFLMASEGHRVLVTMVPQAAVRWSASGGGAEKAPAFCNADGLPGFPGD